MRTRVAAAVLMMTAGTTAAAVTHDSTAAARRALAVTVYPQDLALVADSRAMDLTPGPTTVAWQEVSAQLRPASARLSVRDGAPLTVLSQRYAFDVLSPARLLERYVGRQVRIARTNPATGEERFEEATVLAAAEGPVLRIDDRIETDIPGRVIYPELPAGLYERPALLVDVQATAAGTRTAQLAYLTGGLSWQADYVAELADDDRTLSLRAHASITNHSGASYPDADVRLVAGTVTQVDAPAPAMARGGVMAMAMAEAKQDLQGVPAGDFHVYRVPSPLTLTDRQTVQRALLGADAVPVRKTWRVDGGAHVYQMALREPEQRVPVAVEIAFDNAAPALGMALPAGAVQVYRRDADGALLYAGADRIGHTPAGQEAVVRLGEAFDLTARRVQTDYREGTGWGGLARGIETAHRITLANAGARAATVEVREDLPGEWKIVRESAAHEKISASAARWRLRVPPGGQTVLEYRAAVALP